MSSTIIMVIMICVGLAIGVVGMIIVGRKALALNRALKRIDMPRIQNVSRRVQELTLLMDESAAKRRDLAERMKELQAANKRLSYLREELDSATGRFFKVGSQP